MKSASYYAAFVLGTLIDQSQHRLSGLTSTSLRIFTSIWLACILSITVIIIISYHHFIHDSISSLRFFIPSCQQIFTSIWVACILFVVVHHMRLIIILCHDLILSSRFFMSSCHIHIWIHQVAYVMT